MKILIVHQYFKTPQEGSGIRTWYLARAMMNAGHHVEVLTAHNDLEKKLNLEGIVVHNQRIPYRNEFGFLRRLWSFYLFVLRSKGFLKKQHDFDLLYVLTTPLSTGLIALAGKEKYGIPYVFEVGDLWPLAPIQLGLVPFKWLQKRLYRFEEVVYRQAKKLIALSPAMKEVMEGALERKHSVEVIPNMSDCEFFNPSMNYPSSFDAANPFVISYCGAIGRANHLEYLIDLAAMIDLKKLPIQILIMGEGAMKKKLLKVSKDLKCVEWIGHGGKEQVRHTLNKSHAVYISYASFPVLETGSPNKLFDGLAAGKLIILNFGGWIKDIVERYECGFDYHPQYPESCLEKLGPIIRNPEILGKYQERARNLAEEQFEVSLLCAKAIRFIES